MFLPAWPGASPAFLGRPSGLGGPRGWVSTNWPDRVGAVGRGLLRFGAALCAKKRSSRRSENHCIYRKSFESSYFFKLGSSLERALFGHLRFRFLKKR